MMRNPSCSRFIHPRKGVVAVLVALCLTALIGAIALAIDAGMMQDKRRQVQSTADAAAMSGAIDLYNSLASGQSGTSQARASALAIAAANGFANDGENSIVQVNIPPLSGTYAGVNGYIQVIVTYNQQRAFSGMFGSDVVQVAGSCVAAGSTQTAEGSVLLLDPKAKKSLQVHKNNSSLTVSGDVIVNSTSKDALEVTKKSSLTAKNVVLSGGMKKGSSKLLNVSEKVYLKAAPTTDPLAGLPIPDPGTKRKLKDYETDGVDSKSKTYNLLPGLYDEKMEFKDSDVVNMAPGTYYLTEGMKFSKNASLIGLGVTIFNGPQLSTDTDDEDDDGSHAKDSGGKVGALEFKTKGTITLTPPVSGTYAGISIYEYGGGKKTTLRFDKGGQLNLAGTIYAPNGTVRFQKEEADISGVDTDTGPMPAQIIARKLVVGEGAQLNLSGTSINARKPLLGLAD